MARALASNSVTATFRITASASNFVRICGPMLGFYKMNF
jgi:hypothetical protein